jgi:hypothetical protein
LEESPNQEERERKGETLLGTLSAQGVPEKVMKDQLVAVLVGGRVRSNLCTGPTTTNALSKDSVAIALTWALYELVRHPAIMDELRQGISSTSVFFLPSILLRSSLV